MDVKFYMKREGVDEDYIDIEDYFVEPYTRLRYSKCDGLEDLGKAKNIYTETYADADELRVYLPENVTREATTLTFTFAFIGVNKQKVYDRFCEFITGSKIYYYDTARMKQAYMVFTDKSAPKEDVYKGSSYMVVDFKFQNLWGECRRIDDLTV